MKFADVIGQEGVINKLLLSVANERVSHAQLFAGPEGSGKLALALAYAQYISCQDRKGNDSCGLCPSCLKYEKLIHPDLHFVYPVFKKGSKKDPVSDDFIDKWRELISESPYFNLNTWLNSIGVENEQGLIYSSEASEIIRKLSLKTYESDFKTMIIWLPERMHTATANKLLKLIEEPPEKTIFILVSEDPDKVIPTILSRCQFVRVPAIEKNKLAEALSSRLDVPADKAPALAHVSNGNYALGESLVTNDDVRKSNMDNFINMMRLSWSRDIVKLSEWTEEMAATGREGQKRFLSFCIAQLRENLMMNLGQEKNNIVYLAGKEEEFARKFNRFINGNNIIQLTNEFTLAFNHISANGNAKIIFLDLALKVVKLIRK